MSSIDSMEHFLYNHAGNPVGFCLGNYVFTMDGRPVGQVVGTHVYRLDGAYVGEHYEDMVVNKLRRNIGGVGRAGDPGPITPPTRPPNRGPANYGHPDVFDYLIRRN